MFEDVAGSFCGTSSSSSASIGLCFFVLVKSLGLFASAEIVSPFASVDFLFLVANLNGHSRDFVVPRLLTPHRCISVHVQVLAHAI